MKYPAGHPAIRTGDHDTCHIFALEAQRGTINQSITINQSMSKVDFENVGIHC